MTGMFVGPWILWALCWSNGVWAQLEVRIKDITVSGKTYTLNVGTLDGLKLRDEGVLVSPTAKKGKKILFQSVLVRVFAHESVWWVEKKIVDEKLNHEDLKNTNFILFTKALTLQGRNPPSLSSREIVAQSDELEARVQQQKLGEEIDPSSPYVFKSTDQRSAKARYSRYQELNQNNYLPSNGDDFFPSSKPSKLNRAKFFKKVSDQNFVSLVRGYVHTLEQKNEK